MNHVKKDIKLILKIAWGFHKSTGIDIRELFNEAYLGYIKSLETHDPEKGKLSTWAVTIMKNHLITYLSATQRYKKCFPSLGEGQLEGIEGNEPPPDKSLIFKEALQKMSLDSQSICKLIFTSPIDFLEVGPPKLVRGELYRLLRKQGWSWPRIWSSFNEIKQILNELVM